MAFVFPLGSEPFAEPIDADVTSDGRIAVLDRGAHKVFVFDTTGVLSLTLGAEGRGPGELASPNSIETGPDGEVAVADGAVNRVTIWSRAGARVAMMSLADRGYLGQLWWVGRDMYAKLHVRNVARIGRLDLPSATLAWSVSSPPGDGGEEGCQFCVAAVGPGGRVIFAAADTLYRLSERHRSGNVLMTWSREGLPAARYSAAEREDFARGMRLGSALAGASSPPPGAPEFKARIRGKALAVDSTGRIFALPSRPEGEQSVIDVFSRDGSFLGSLSPGHVLQTVKVRHGWLVSLTDDAAGQPAVLVFRIVEASTREPPVDTL